MTIAAPVPGSPAWRVLSQAVAEPGDWTPDYLAELVDCDPADARRWVREWRKPVRVPGLDSRAPLVLPRLVRLFRPFRGVKWYHGKVQTRILCELENNGSRSALELARATGGTKVDARGREKSTTAWDRALSGLYDLGDVSPASRVWPSPAAVALVTAPPVAA